jgi:hypothetical protein
MDGYRCMQSVFVVLAVSCFVTGLVLLGTLPALPDGYNQGQLFWMVLTLMFSLIMLSLALAVEIERLRYQAMVGAAGADGEEEDEFLTTTTRAQLTQARPSREQQPGWNLHSPQVDEMSLAYNLDTGETGPSNSSSSSLNALQDVNLVPHSYGARDPAPPSYQEVAHNSYPECEECQTEHLLSSARPPTRSRRSKSHPLEIVAWLPPC